MSPRGSAFAQPFQCRPARKKTHFAALVAVVVAAIPSLCGSQAFSLMPSMVSKVLARTTLLARLGDSAAALPSTSSCSEDLRALVSSQPFVGYHFRKFLHEKGLEPTFQFAKIPEAIVQEFLALHDDGALEQFEVVSAETTAKLDDLREKDTQVLWYWGQICGQKAFGTTRPDAVPAQVVHEFLESFQAGTFERLEMASDSLVAEVRALQKSSSGKDLWNTFRGTYPGQANTRDPKLWPAEHVRRFLAQAKV
ncbi:unnamed protein product [Polarella glacialis]|uniref:Uncharacterized protein n=1 Tax=Polarella glacialis TaxID=89957 RepID=A0A813F5Y6_POLGL|nr:unnamed protein product [Polarella glacialis]CAE8717141.1 unnamed protein product [Polarella glacialis]